MTTSTATTVVHSIYINAPAQRVWDAITRSEYTTQWGYGGAVVINKILELTPDRFREEVVCRIEPETTGEYPHGFHTINILDGMCVVDGKKIVTDWAWPFRRLLFRACTHTRRRRRRGRVAGELPSWQSA